MPVSSRGGRGDAIVDNLILLVELLGLSDGRENVPFLDVVGEHKS